MESIGLSRKEFNALPEYSLSNPTGVIIGKQWKRESDHRWFLCEYAPSDNSEYALIKVRAIIILEENKVLEEKMSANFLLSRHAMQLLLERLQENIWYLEEQRNMYEEGGESYKIYQELMNDDKELMDKLDFALSKE